MSSARAVVSEIAGWACAGVVLALTVLYAEDINRAVHSVLATGGSTVARDATDAPRNGDRTAKPATGGVEIAAGRHGHFIVEAEINGRSVEVMVDTGASVVALTWEDAERAGIYVRPSDFTGRVSTANGQARVAPVMLESVSIGDIKVRNVRAVVSERGAMNSTLLGMAFLSRLSKVEMRPGRLLLHD